MDKLSSTKDAFGAAKLELDIMRLSVQEEGRLVQPVKSWIEQWFPRREAFPRSLLLVIERAEGEGGSPIPSGLSQYLAWVANAGGYAYLMQDCTKLDQAVPAGLLEQWLHDFQRHPSLGVICIRETLSHLLPMESNEPHQEFNLPFNLLKISRA